MRAVLTWLPTALLAVLPKCPLCAAGYLALLGVSAPWARAGGAWTTPLAAVCVLAVVARLATRAKRRAGVACAVLGALGGAALLAARCGVPIPAMPWAGVAPLAVALAWSGRAHRAPEPTRCVCPGPALVDR